MLFLQVCVLLIRFAPIKRLDVKQTRLESRKTIPLKNWVTKNSVEGEVRATKR